ncbi:MAG: hypothetical protein AB8B55_11860 [Mariniblastus sp.]
MPRSQSSTIRFSQPVLVAAIAIFVLFDCQFCHSHILEDGFVERTVEVVVRDDVARVEYSVGLNERTMLQLLAGWDVESAKRALELSDGVSTSKNYAPDDESAQAKGKIDSGEKSTPKQESDLSQLSKASADASTTDAPAVQPPGPANSKSNSALPVPKTTKVPNSKNTATDDSSVENATTNEPKEPAIDAKTLALFAKIAPSKIKNGLKITCDGKPIKVSSLSLDAAPRHPFNLKVVFELSVPKSTAETVQLIFQDENFAKQTGAVRYALKTKGNAMLMRSNVAPIIIRAQRVELAGLSSEQREQKTKIIARLAIVDAKTK